MTIKNIVFPRIIKQLVIIELRHYSISIVVLVSAFPQNSLNGEMAVMVNVACYLNMQFYRNNDAY